VLADIESGRDLLVRRGDNTAAVSTDGRFAAVFLEPFALTWWRGTVDLGPVVSRVEIRDLRTRRLIFCGRPSGLEDYRRSQPQLVAWSPDASWIALQLRREDGSRAPYDGVLLIRADGRRCFELPLWPGWYTEIEKPHKRWAWSASGRAVYALVAETGQTARATPGLVRCVLPEGRSVVIWRPPSASQLPAGYGWVTAGVSASPDGRWIAVGLVAVPFRLGPNGEGPVYPVLHDKTLVDVYLAASSGKGSSFLGRTALDHGFDSLDYVWRQDGKALHYLVRPESAVGGDLRSWREGESRATSVALPPETWPREIAGLPNGNDVLVWGRDDVLLLHEQGNTRPFPNARVRSLSREYRLLGLDAHGRAIVCNERTDTQQEATMLGAVNLATGDVKQVYP
jgi:hypothetical protein